MPAIQSRRAGHVRQFYYVIAALRNLYLIRHRLNTTEQCGGQKNVKLD